MADSSIKRSTRDKIEAFFNEEYNDIVEHQIAASDKDDFQADKVLTKLMKVTKHINEYNLHVFTIYTYDASPTKLTIQYN